MTRIIFSILAFIAPICAVAQGLPEGTEHLDPSRGWAGPAVFRSEFISYDTRQLAEAGDVTKNKFYLPLDLDRTPTREGVLYSVVADIPYIWLDRDVYLQVSGLNSYYIYIGDRMVAYGEDSRLPMQFLISDFITDGENRISIMHAPGIAPAIESGAEESEQLPSAFIFSQPKVSIHDYRLRFFPDSTGSYGIFNVRLALSNTYNSEETITVGYDIYSPKGKLQYYDMRQVTIAGRGADTVRFNEFIYRTNENIWSPEKPLLYYGMMTVRRENRMVEYIPFKIGFGKTGFADGQLLRNGMPVDIRPVRYNAPSKDEAGLALAGFKKEGYNTILPDYPQPLWFYEMCDRVGFYVFDAANINPSQGSMGNEPQWLGRFVKRAESMRARNVNRTSVVGWSLGSGAGNGYNMYKTYLEFKNRELFRPVIYNYADGQWNTDMSPLLLPGTPANVNPR